MGNADTPLTSLPNIVSFSAHPTFSPKVASTGYYLLRGFREGHSPATLISLLSIEKGLGSPQPGGVCGGKQGKELVFHEAPTLLSQRTPTSSPCGSKNVHSSGTWRWGGRGGLQAIPRYQNLQMLKDSYKIVQCLHMILHTLLVCGPLLLRRHYRLCV